MWDMVRWLYQKPTDLDRHCFLKKEINLGPAGQGLNMVITWPREFAFSAT